ncbi:MAG TPA: proline racemase family protein [Candidatus Nosocomiicoccus stercorigallinarum]|nr:proline racemase family protein [Candidatus Nosocomiicoccus stercorigallinarum]
MFELEIQTIDTHTVGEATRIVVDGFPEIVGETMMEKKNYVSKNYDYLRKFLMNEPRGHKDMFGAILTEPSNKECDLGVIFMDSGSYLNMCGHGTIGVVTMSINKGFIPKKERVFIDSPSGIIECYVYYDNDLVESVELINVPSFTVHKDLKIEVHELGKISVDIAFGGSFFVIVDKAELGIDIELNNISKLINASEKIKNYINEKIKVEHPYLKEINTVDLVEISEKLSYNHYKNVVIFGNNQVDRSPCGTGTCAKIATLGLSPGSEIIQESIIGSKFLGKVLDTVEIGEYEGIIPSVRGSAWITGEHKFLLQNCDIYSEGFAL